MSSSRKKSKNASRLEACLAKPDNQTCSECSEEGPTWASLLLTPGCIITTATKKKTTTPKMGVFCCYKCCSYHIQLGREICIVKNIKSIDDCKSRVVVVVAVDKQVFQEIAGHVSGWGYPSWKFQLTLWCLLFIQSFSSWNSKYFYRVRSGSQGYGTKWQRYHGSHFWIWSTRD